MAITIPDVGASRPYPIQLPHNIIVASEYVHYFMHLLGVEFTSGNPEVDGVVRGIELPVRNMVYVRGNRGYARKVMDCKFIDEDGTPMSYADYTLKYYPEMRHIVTMQLHQYKS